MGVGVRAGVGAGTAGVARTNAPSNFEAMEKVEFPHIICMPPLLPPPIPRNPIDTVLLREGTKMSNQSPREKNPPQGWRSLRLHRAAELPEIDRLSHAPDVGVARRTGVGTRPAATWKHS